MNVNVTIGHGSDLDPAGRRGKRAWNRAFAVTLASVSIITASSYIRWFVTGSFKVDDNYPTGWPMVLNVVLFLGALAAAGYAYIKVVLRRKGWNLDLAQVRRLAMISAGIASLMMPMLSNDIFSRLAYGDLVLKGVNPYTHAEKLATSNFAPLVGRTWAEAPCVYGPVTVFADAAAALAGRRSILAGLAALDAIQLAFTLLFIQAAWLFFSDTEKVRAPGPGEEAGGKYNTAAMIMLAPLVWMMGSGQGHNDIMAAALLMVSLVLMRRKKFAAAALPLALAAMAKIYALIAVPLFLLAVWSELKNDRKRLIRVLAASLAIAMAALVVLDSPLWDSGRALSAPAGFIKHKLASKSIPRMISTAVVITEDILHPGSGPREARTRAIEAPLAICLKILSLVLAVHILAGLFSRRGLDEFLPSFAALAAVVICFYSPVFHPWYFVGLIPLFAELKRPEWVIWSAAVFASAGAMNVIHIAGYADLPVRGIAAMLIGATGLLFFWKFRSRFLYSGHPFISSMNGRG